MHRLQIVIFLFILCVCSCSGDPYDDFIKKFTDNYNSQNFVESYDLTAEVFKKQVSKEYFVQILTSTFTNAGKINSHKVAESSAQGRIFHLTCERLTLALSVALDSEGKAAGLFIKPVQNTSGGAQGMIDNWKANKANAGLVVGKIKDGKADIQFYGVANKENAAPLNAGSIFEIGSISKPFTGILLHLLINEGKIAMNDPLNKYLPEEGHLPKIDGKDITVRNLVTHAACLPRMPGNFNPPASGTQNPYMQYTEKDLLAFLPSAPMADCSPGKSSLYSNLGAGLMGYILTRVYGKSYTEMFNERLAKPLQTKSFGVMPPSDKWTHGYTESGTAHPNWDFTDALVGAGGVDASAEDLSTILKVLMKPDESVLGKAVRASTTVKILNDQGGIGTFWARQTSGQKTIIWHNGMTGGFNAFIGWIEGTETGVFILSNNGVDIATGLGFAIINEQ